MVSETVPGVMSACADFTQNAWKRDLCVNCQRPRGEHATPGQPGSSQGQGHSVVAPDADSPKPAKRNSLMSKSWTASRTDGEPDEDEKWAAMCVPVSGRQSREKTPDSVGTTEFVRREHCYEDIEGDSMRLGTMVTSDTGTGARTGSRGSLENSAGPHSRAGTSNSLPNCSSLNPVQSSLTPVQKPSSRSRSSSREKSPAPSLKPKPSVDITKITQTKDSSKVSPQTNKKLRKNQKSLSFVEDQPEIIGEDGGMDNLVGEGDEVGDEMGDGEGDSEVLVFSETEKDWALQSLKNTIWNTEHIGGTTDSSVARKPGPGHSHEYEDAEMEEGRDDNMTHNFGTFPLRTKSEKSAIDSMFTGNRLSTLSETLENTGTDVSDDSENKYDSVIRFLNGGRLDLASSPKRGGNNDNKQVAREAGIATEMTESSYDDPWEDKFGLNSDSDMNLLDEIKGEIDLDSSNAGFALVDLLNDVLAKYSTGSPSDTDSVRNLDGLEEQNSDSKHGKEKSAELEARVATLAASLRKQRAKGRAPRPPSHPPDPPPGAPPEGTKSPAKQLELRAAQSKEPTFKMVPIGKPIGSSALSQSAPAPSSGQSDSLPLSASTPENMEAYKIKTDRTDKDKHKKGGGGIGSFFSRILRRGGGRDSDTELTASSETLVSQSGSDVQSDSESQSDKDKLKIDNKKHETDSGKPERRSSKSSPQLKMKVLPVRPMSPKGVNSEKVSVSDKQDTEESSADVKSSQTSPAKDSLAPEPKPRIEGAGQDKHKSSLQTSKPKPDSLKPQLSPTKGERDTTLPVSPKNKEAPPLPLNPPRETIEPVPKPRGRGNSDGGVPRSRPRTRDLTDGKQRDTPSGPPPKPPVAAKPRPQTAAPTKPPESLDNKHEPVSATSSLDDEVAKATKAGNVGEQQTKVDPKVLRKRAKSPKRFAAPSAPVRASMPNILADSTTSINSNATGEGSTVSLPGSSTRPDSKVPFAKELELKLSKEAAANSAPGSVMSEVRKLSMTAPPTSPGTRHDSADKPVTRDNKDTHKPGAKDTKPVAKETEKSKSSSKDDLKLSPPLQDKPGTVTMETTDTVTMATVTTSGGQADVPIQPEKIELPKPAGNSRKSFLGKLNRKNRPPPPPSVKRTKSITESSIAAETHLRKIDLKDISGPVLITDMTSNKAVNRRNTISLGDDNPFLSGGSTSSGSTSAGEKCDLSPRGSVENLYEFITSEAPTPPGPPAGDKKNLYDPVVENTVGLRPPSMTGSEGYLEPVRSANGPALGEPVKSNMSDSMISLGAMTTSLAGMNQSLTGELETVAGGDLGTDVPVLDDARQQLLASQPIYEEINGYGKLGSDLTPAAAGTNSAPHTDDTQEVYGVADGDTGHHGNMGAPELGVMLQSHHSGILPASKLKTKDSFSSESDLSSASNSLTRPRPIPRRRPRQVGSGFEQYVAMNRPSVAVFLNEEQLREMLSKLTAMNTQTLRELYTQHEKCFTKETVQLGAVGPLKWHDFDIYGKPLHTSEKCIVYNAKLKSSLSPCQVMLLHSRPEITCDNHPSLLKPTCIFTDSIPFSYLTEEFIRTSQILETCGVGSMNQSTSSNTAKCYVVVGVFDITESVWSHMEAIAGATDNQRDFLRKVLFLVLQLLSAISHCLEQGLPLAEADLHDLYLISGPRCHGDTLAFLPQLRAPEDQQIDSVCLYLEKFLHDMCERCEATAVLDDSAFFIYTGIQKMTDLLAAGVAECLPVVRSYAEFLLWGPRDDLETELKNKNRQSNVEPKLSMWLEQQRAGLIHELATREQSGGQSISDFYRLKFLLKASSGSLAECIRCHTGRPADT